MRSPNHVLRWVGAESFVAAPTRPSPALLRFDSDDFMERMLALLETRPQDLHQLVAKRESWQGLAEPTPVTALEPARSAPARALERQRSLLGFKRSQQAAQSPPASANTSLTVLPAKLRADAQPLKLFQPVHQRFYLAAAHLVCELPGLPNRTTASGDKSGMLLRRLLPNGGEAATLLTQRAVHAFGTVTSSTPSVNVAATSSALMPCGRVRLRENVP